MMILVVSVSITKDQRLGGLNNRNLFLTVLGAKPKIKVPADSVSGEGPLPCLQNATFLLCLHVVEMISSMSFIRALIPFMRALPS